MIEASLRGVSVLVTRPEYAAATLSEFVTAAGGLAIRQAGVEILPANANLQLTESQPAQIAIFTSRPAVRFGLTTLLARDWSVHTQLLAVGPATATELERQGRPATAFAAGSSSESLLALPSLQQLDKQRVLIFGAPEGRTLLQRELRQRGACVDAIYVYRRRPARLSNEALQQAVQNFDRLIVSVSSVAILTNIVEMFENRLPQPIQQRPVAVASTRIAKTAEQIGFTQIEIAASNADSALLQTVSSLASKMKGRPE